MSTSQKKRTKVRVSTSDSASVPINVQGSHQQPASARLPAQLNNWQKENMFLFWPNVIGYIQVLLAFASLYYMPHHPQACSALYSISCLLDALDGYAARYFKQGTRFGTALDMVTNRCTTTCLLVYLAMAWKDCALIFQVLISLDLASHYFHMYATLTVGNTGSHKDVDASRSWLLNLYYTNKVVLFVCCACNEAFFIALCLISFSPSLLPSVPLREVGCVPWFYHSWQLAGMNMLFLVAGLCFPVMLLKQFINVVQFVKASRWLAEGDSETRKQQRLVAQE